MPAEGDATADGGDGGLGDLLDAAISTEGEEPVLDEGAEPTSADLSLEQAVCETEAEQTPADSGDAFAGDEFAVDDAGEGEVAQEEVVEQPADTVEA